MDDANISLVPYALKTIKRFRVVQKWSSPEVVRNAGSGSFYPRVTAQNAGGNPDIDATSNLQQYQRDIILDDFSFAQSEF